MIWILGGIYCGALWLIFAKWKLVRMSLPVAVLAASVGPTALLILLFCAQYFHPYTQMAKVFERVTPIVPQLSQPGRVTDVEVAPNIPVRKGEILFRVDTVPYQNAVERSEARLAEAIQNHKVAETAVEVARARIDRATSELEFATRERDRQKELIEQGAGSDQEYESAINRHAEAVAVAAQAATELTQSKLSVEVAETQTTQSETALADAQYDLKQTTVTAPSDGFVSNLQLREGMLVGGPASTAVMSFVADRDDFNRSVIVASFKQKNFLRIHPGQYAEVALYNYPGRIFTARVLNRIDVSGSGQMAVSGNLPENLGGTQVTTFPVRVRLDNADDIHMPGGSQANVAIYTESVQFAGIPIMFLIRAQSWLRYLQ
ncbi:HlyD family secretion protein [Allorhodopirellula solitaria]|uniref:Inner membrane protein YibH n=1 Tax=Allorhodopirellula solitaria TaxID=2527987 RepID=A0A5C5YG42_9BACT|nr:HlyD family secretion protein [Allorhodopirellula solitaria]TWT74114.1 Inner membrane protein YibH [Allorhodopirellula solitaria]